MIHKKYRHDFRSNDLLKSVHTISISYNIIPTDGLQLICHERSM